MNAPAHDLVGVLVDQKIITDEIAGQIRAAEVQSGKSQEEILIGQKVASEEALAHARAAFYNVPYVDLSTVIASPEAMVVFPQSLAQKFTAFPLVVNQAVKNLDLAMADPLNLTAIEFIEQKIGYKVRPFVAEASKIEEYIVTKYSSSLTQEVSDTLKKATEERLSSTVSTSVGQTKDIGLVREERISEIVNRVLDFAVRARASDVHIEPQEISTRVRYRIDGILQEKLSIPKALHDSLVSRIKILSGLKIDEKRVPQDGRFNFQNDNAEVDLRVSTLPTTWGEKIVMRLLKKSGGVPTLNDLGLRGTALKALEEAILRPHGIITICGPTGSGKTTTLYSIISRINTPKVNIVTLEDPIEYKIAGVNQVQINPAAGLTFASGLRAFLRQDPNVILVGEIRDKETADLAIQASLTGHLVFSTLHTNDAAGALPRLLDMGEEPYLLASSMTCIVAQRVVRKIHDACKKEYEPEPRIVEEVKTSLGPLWAQKPGPVKFYKGEGDADCGNSGYYGRVGIFEVIAVNEKISRLILERSAAPEIDKVAREQGMITLKQDGYLKILEGMTSYEEILRVAQE